MAFKVAGAWWNGHSWEIVTREEKTVKSAIGAASLLLRECRPYQVWIVDLNNKEPIPDDLGLVASSLNKIESNGQQTLAEVIE